MGLRHSRPEAREAIARSPETVPDARLMLSPPRGHAMREDDQDRSNDNAGHRARLRDRLLGGGGLLDHELIEYLLTTAIPRRDTKPIAKALLREFHDIGGVLTADPIALRRVDGVGETAAAALKIAHACALRLVQAEAAKRPILSNWQALLDYLHADMAHHAVERFRVLHLNTRNMLIRDELMGEGSIDQRRSISARSSAARSTSARPR